MIGQQTFLSYSRPPADLSRPVIIDVWYYLPHCTITNFEQFGGTLQDAGTRALAWVDAWLAAGGGDRYGRHLRHVLIRNVGAPAGEFSAYSPAGFRQIVSSRGAASSSPAISRGSSAASPSPAEHGDRPDGRFRSEEIA